MQNLAQPMQFFLQRTITCKIFFFIQTEVFCLTQEFLKLYGPILKHQTSLKTSHFLHFLYKVFQFLTMQWCLKKLKKHRANEVHRPTLLHRLHTTDCLTSQPIYAPGLLVSDGEECDCQAEGRVALTMHIKDASLTHCIGPESNFQTSTLKSESRKHDINNFEWKFIKSVISVSCMIHPSYHTKCQEPLDEKSVWRYEYDLLAQPARVDS